jgi:hypothetical protein
MKVEGAHTRFVERVNEIRCAKVLLLLAVITASNATYAEGGGSTTVYAVSSGDGPQYRWAIPHERAAAQAQWSPEQGAPPLAMNEAMNIGARWLKSRNPSIESFAANSIELASYIECCKSQRHIWYYRIDFSAVVGGKEQRDLSNLYTAVVMLDGFVVEPKVAK